MNDISGIFFKLVPLNGYLQMMPSVGDRIDVEGDRGTLRYVGEVEGYSGMWYGVEWDNETRGKHDGQINGRRYFHTRLVFQ